jgi:hypothetical protein
MYVHTYSAEWEAQDIHATASVCKLIYRGTNIGTKTRKQGVSTVDMQQPPRSSLSAGAKLIYLSRGYSAAVKQAVATTHPYIASHHIILYIISYHSMYA